MKVENALIGFFAILALLILLVFVPMAAWDEGRFDGVCDYLKGENKGSVCIKDGKVVLDSDDL